MPNCCECSNNMKTKPDFNSQNENSLNLVQKESSAHFAVRTLSKTDPTDKLAQKEIFVKSPYKTKYVLSTLNTEPNWLKHRDNQELTDLQNRDEAISEIISLKKEYHD